MHYIDTVIGLYDSLGGNAIRNKAGVKETW